MFWRLRELNSRARAIKHKSKIRNKYNKWRSRENYIEWQTMKYKRKKLANKAGKDHFGSIIPRE